ncbi:MAG TPA: hypothetical protein VK277_00035 [Acidimicrobiales bacterium]|nr:hypothetical protein [Acidimicrobiales bacterium]
MCAGAAGVGTTVLLTGNRDNQSASAGATLSLVPVDPHEGLVTVGTAPSSPAFSGTKHSIAAGRVSCSSVGRCVATGVLPAGGGDLTTAKGDIAYSTSGGATWKAVTASGVETTCPSSAACLALWVSSTQQWFVERSTDGGATWKRAASRGLGAEAHFTWYALTCASSSHCVVLGDKSGGPGIAAAA